MAVTTVDHDSSTDGDSSTHVSIEPNLHNALISHFRDLHME